MAGFSQTWSFGAQETWVDLGLLFGSFWMFFFGSWPYYVWPFINRDQFLKTFFLCKFKVLNQHWTSILLKEESNLLYHLSNMFGIPLVYLSKLSKATQTQAKQTSSTNKNTTKPSKQKHVSTTPKRDVPCYPGSSFDGAGAARAGLGEGSLGWCSKEDPVWAQCGD